MNTVVASLLQITAAFLMGVQHNPQATLTTQEQAVLTASHVVQLSEQAIADIPFNVPQNDSNWPNIHDVDNAPYLNSQGNFVQLGQGVDLISSNISFGDINGDGVDDAVVLVRQYSPVGTPSYALAALINQGGILFNIADAPLGSTTTIYDHQIANGVLTIDLQTATQPRETLHYTLLGNDFSAD